MGFIERLFGNEKLPPQKTGTLNETKKRAGLKIPDTALHWPKKDAAAEVFTVPAHPPCVGEAGATIAQDSAIAESAGWANAALQGLGSFWVEGTTFLGYAYLSELAQKPEYRVISETLATEMTRKWIRFVSKGDDDKTDRIAELDAEFKRLKVRDLFCRAAQQDGFFGRGHIYVDTGDSDDPAELNTSIGDGWDTVSKGKVSKNKPIKSLRTVEAVWCYPTSYNSNDPLKDDWYRPNSWYVQAKIVHSSRLITFIGREVPDLLKPTYSFGGLSLSQMAKPYVDNFLRNRQSASDIVNAFSVFVLLSNLQESLQGDGDQLFKRAKLFNEARSNAGLMILDKDSEDFKNVSAQLGGVSDLLAKSQEMMCMPAHAPVVKLWGIQPAGLNADSEGVMRSYYDYIHSYQEHLFRDKIHRLMGLVMLSIWDEVDDGIGFEFEPLWALDEEKQAQVRKIEAETDQILIDNGEISPEEGRKRVAADPDTPYHGLDPDDAPDLLDEEEQGLEPQGGRPQPIAQGGEESEDAVSRLFGPQRANA
jgi:phage-related protein (TIGR01555 family)